MTRLLTTMLVVALLVATAAAFAVAENLKLERSPIIQPQVRDAFSPTCGCDRWRAADIAFRLREPDRLSVAILRGDEVVRTLAEDERHAAGPVRFVWDGRDDAGRLLPEGTYRPRLHLAEKRRTFLLPQTIELDRTPPRVTAVEVVPPVLSPDGDGRRDRLIVRYRLNEPAHGILYVNGKRRVRGRFPRQEELRWFGKVRGRAVRPGRYTIAIGARDLAGNLSRRRTIATIRVRYVELAREVVRARARTRFGVRVDTDAQSFRWRFAGRTGVGRPGLLVLRAPRAGRYVLYVTANGHGDRARVVVRPRPGRRVP